MRVLGFILIMLLQIQNSQACQELIWSPSEYANKSSLVYVGLVKTMSLDEPTTQIDLKTYVNSKRIEGSINVTLKVLKSLKGESVDNLEIPLHWCGGGQYELGDLVVAYKLRENWHVKSSSLAIEQSIKA